LQNFYQNHRRYVKSRNDKQLSGDVSQTESCAPIDTAATPQTTLEGTGPVPIYPCGLIANSFFTDTFQVGSITLASVLDCICYQTLTFAFLIKHSLFFSSVNKNSPLLSNANSLIPSFLAAPLQASHCRPSTPGRTCSLANGRLQGESWSDKGIAWQTDVADKFKVPTKNFDRNANFTSTYTRLSPSAQASNKPLPLPDNEHFMVVGVGREGELIYLIHDLSHCRSFILHIRFCCHSP
jgi:hypothetical protein